MAKTTPFTGLLQNFRSNSPSSMNPNQSITGVYLDGVHRTVRVHDIQQRVMDNFFEVQDVVIEVIKQSNKVKVTVLGASKEAQLEIHRFLEQQLPIGVCIDVYRAEIKEDRESRGNMTRNNAEWGF